MKLFSPPKIPTPALPATKRMPTATDPAIEAAAQRSRMEALRRKGRLSTIMTDKTTGTSGYPSSGVKLGA